MEIAGSVVLVTGGASGLGAATVRMLSEAGARVVAADLREPSSLPPAARYIRTDVTNPQEMAASVDDTLSASGALHGLVNCAGIVEGARILGKEGPLPLERFRRVIEVNLIGAFNALRLAAAAMARNEPNTLGERGVIVNTSSVAAFDGQIGQAAYAASKGGIAALTLPAARDLSRNGIRVVAIAPGVFDTPMMAGMPPAVREALEASVPFPPRLGRPEEFALLVRHIFENPMLNGEVIRLDGALRMAPK